MNRRLLLYVSSAGASLALWENGALKSVTALPADVEGWEQLNAQLLEQPGLPLYVVADSVEELYRSETLPRAWGRDRRDMTGRRLRQILHQTPYRTVMRQGPAGPGVVGERYLFMGLTAPEILRPWLDVIQLRGAPLAGIWLAPPLSQALLGRFRLTDRQLLLVSEQTGGLRLSYFEGAQLRFSRLAPVDNALYDDPLEGYGEEIERTRQFLLSQRLLNRSDALKTYLIDPLNSLERLKQILPASAGFLCETVDRSRILAALRLPADLLAGSSDALFLALLAQAPSAANLLPEELRRSYAHHRMRRWLYTGSGVWLAASALLILALLADAWRLERAAEGYRERAAQAREHARQILGKRPDTARFGEILAAVQAWRFVERRAADPAAAIVHILEVAGRHPGVRIRRVRWTGPRAASGEQMRLEGEVHPFSGDYQAAHRTVGELQTSLGQAGWRAEVERWPLEAGANRELRGEFGRGQGRLAAGFELRLEREGGR